MNDLNDKTFADVCFDQQLTDDKLFGKLHEILSNGGTLDDCNKEDFKWTAVDCWVDYYDGSVEVILDPEAEPITKEQAQLILDLGFSQIYESQGDRGTNWTKHGKSSCSPRKGDQDKCTILKLRTEVNFLNRRLLEFTS